MREIGVRDPIGLNELAAELDWNGEPNTPTPLFLSLFARTMVAICIGCQLDFLPGLESSSFLEMFDVRCYTFFSYSRDNENSILI